MPKCSISVPKWKRLKLKHAWQLVLIQIINGRLLTGNKILVTTGPFMNGTHKCQKLISV